MAQLFITLISVFLSAQGFAVQNSSGPSGTRGPQELCALYLEGVRVIEGLESTVVYPPALLDKYKKMTGNPSADESDFARFWLMLQQPDYTNRKFNHPRGNYHGKEMIVPLEDPFTSTSQNSHLLRISTLFFSEERVELGQVSLDQKRKLREWAAKNNRGIHFIQDIEFIDSPKQVRDAEVRDFFSTQFLKHRERALYNQRRKLARRSQIRAGVPPEDIEYTDENLWAVQLPHYIFDENLGLQFRRDPLPANPEAPDIGPLLVTLNGKESKSPKVKLELQNFMIAKKGSPFDGWRIGINPAMLLEARHIFGISNSDLRGAFANYNQYARNEQKGTTPLLIHSDSHRENEPGSDWFIVKIHNRLFKIVLSETRHFEDGKDSFDYRDIKAILLANDSSMEKFWLAINQN